jgi:hypothetical protein
MQAPVPTHIGVQPTSSKPAPRAPARPAAPNPLLNPNQSLSGQALLNAAQQLANVQVNPALSDLSKQIATNNAQTKGTINLTGGFYNQLEPFVQQGAAQQGQIASGLNSTLQGIGNDTQNQLAGIGQNAQGMISKYAPQGDGGISNAATADLAAQIAKQQGLAAQQAGTYRAFGANQGANYQGLGTSQLGTYGLQGQEALKNIAQSGTVKNEPLVSKIAGLQQQKGALVATDLGKLRQQEVANGISRSALGIKTTALKQTAAQNGARNFLTNQGQQITAKNDQAKLNQAATNSNPLTVGSPAWQRVQGLKTKNWSENPNAVGSPAWSRVQTANRANSKRTGAGPKPLTTQENTTWFGKLGTVATLIDQGRQHGLSAAQIKANLSDGANPTKIKFDQTMIEAAYELKGWGHVIPQTAAAMRSLGIRGGVWQNAPIRVAPPPTKSRDISRTVANTGGSLPAL